MKVVTASNGKQTVRMSKKEWQDIGKKAGWMKKAQEIGGELDSMLSENPFENSDQNLEDKVSRRRSVEVTLSDGEVIRTEINGTKEEIEKYYLNNEFVAQDENTMRKGVSVEFLG